MGDFNAKVCEIDEPEVIGAHSNVSRGYNARERLVEFCKQNELFITNTFCFQHRSKYTWTSPGESVRNTIDFILTCKNSRHIVCDSGTVAHPDVSDHRLVRCDIHQMQ